MTAPAAGAPVVACGEVRTCLLQHSAALADGAASQLLQPRSGERVRISKRPNTALTSPDVLTGVDCQLATGSGSRVRGIGTVLSHATLTDGRVLQASAHLRVLAAEAGHRQPWGHYLVRPGVVEAVGRAVPEDLADGFLRGGQASLAGTVDLGAVGERLLAELLARPQLDRRPPFKSRRTRLRWSAVRSGDTDGVPRGRFTIVDDTERTLRLEVGSVDPEALARLCEDLALHDWLLTTLIQMVDRSGLGTAPGPDAVIRLSPAVDHLLHLWMPMARVDLILMPLWESLETKPGFTRQWQALVQRIRDQLALQSVTLHRKPHALT
jgi:hypothetical protein